MGTLSWILREAGPAAADAQTSITSRFSLSSPPFLVLELPEYSRVFRSHPQMESLS